MNIFETLFAKPIFQALGWALINFIWQGTLVAMILATVNIFLQRRSANARYIAACGALFLMLAFPIGTAIYSYAQPKQVLAERAVSQNSPTNAQRSINDSELPDANQNAQQSIVTEAPQSVSTPVIQRTLSRLSYMMPWFVAIWSIGVLALSLRFLGGIAVTRRLRYSKAQPASLWIQNRVARYLLK